MRTSGSCNYIYYYCLTFIINMQYAWELEGYIFWPSVQVCLGASNIHFSGSDLQAYLSDLSDRYRISFLALLNLCINMAFTEVVF